MSDPLPTDPSLQNLPGPQAPQGNQAPASAPREAKIERLLLTGLDHYFDGHYDQAINIWTRALFLDRGHARARAYIERARGALAERQRESEELLQRGLAAFDRGASAEARRLLEAAITRGAPRDEALSVLDRIQRLDPPINASIGPPARAPIELPTTARTSSVPHDARARWLMASAATGLAGLVVGLMAAGLLSVQVRWGRPQPTSTPAAALSANVDDAMPLPRRGERALHRARLLAQTGRLRDSLASLDQIAMTDEERPAADRLRAEIQRHLIAAGSTPSALPAMPEPGPPAGRTP